MRSAGFGFSFGLDPNERIVGVDLPIEEVPPTREVVFAALDYYENWLRHYMYRYCRAKDAGNHKKAAAHMAKITRLDMERMVWRQALGYALASDSATTPTTPAPPLPAAFFADDEAEEAAQ